MRKKILLFWLTILILNVTFSFAQDTKSLFELGKSYWDNRGKYSQSIKKFQKIINGNPRDGLADDDKFWISGSYEKLADSQNVKDPYQKMLTNHLNSKRINQAKYEIERVEYLIRNYVRVIESEQTEIQVEF